MKIIEKKKLIKETLTYGCNACCFNAPLKKGRCSICPLRIYQMQSNPK
jgi:hypothetical protein